MLKPYAHKVLDLGDTKNFSAFRTHYTVSDPTGLLRVLKAHHPYRIGPALAQLLENSITATQGLESKMTAETTCRNFNAAVNFYPCGCGQCCSADGKVVNRGMARS